ncbi:MAG: hypothetical protein ACREEM_01800 [Blastocatellia bacterium]
MKQFFVALVLFCISPLTLAGSEGGYKIETLGALTETKVAEAVRNVLSDKGMKIVAKDGKTVCEIWFRKEVPVTGASVDGATFGQIPESALIGVIHFPSNTSDFRGQGIKAGFYTLRFGLSMQDGNHLGVSPARDFFILCNVSEDKDPKDLSAADAIKFSRNASGAGHPSPWALTYPTSEKDLPRIVVNEHEHVVLEVALKTKSGELAIGFIIIGKTEG